MAEPVGETPLTILAGVDTILEGTLTSAAGTAVDLTAAGVGLEFRVRAAIHEATNLASKTLGAGVTGAANGTYTIRLEDTEKVALKGGGDYVYGLLFTTSNGDIDIVARGPLKVIATVAR